MLFASTCRNVTGEEVAEFFCFPLWQRLRASEEKKQTLGSSFSYFAHNLRVVLMSLLRFSFFQRSPRTDGKQVYVHCALLGYSVCTLCTAYCMRFSLLCFCLSFSPDDSRTSTVFFSFLLGEVGRLISPPSSVPPTQAVLRESGDLFPFPVLFLCPSEMQPSTRTFLSLVLLFSGSADQRFVRLPLVSLSSILLLHIPGLYHCERYLFSLCRGGSLDRVLRITDSLDAKRFPRKQKKTCPCCSSSPFSRLPFFLSFFLRAFTVFLWRHSRRELVQLGPKKVRRERAT